MARSSLIGGEKKEIIDDILTGRNPTRLILQFVKRVSRSSLLHVSTNRSDPTHATLGKKKKRKGEKTWKQTVRQFRRGKLFVSSVGIDTDRETASRSTLTVFDDKAGKKKKKRGKKD